MAYVFFISVMMMLMSVMFKGLEVLEHSTGKKER